MTPTFGKSNPIPAPKGKKSGPSRPRIAITMGDPAGIGPEICVRLLQQKEIAERCVPLILGDVNVLNDAASQLGLPLPKNVHSRKSIKGRQHLSAPAVIDFETDEIHQVNRGQVSKPAGQAAFQYIETGIDWHLRGWVDAVTTGPINKLALNAAGHDYPGHTEIFAEKTNSPNFCMMQYSTELTCSFVTTHVGYADVPGLLTTQRIVDVIELSAGALRSIRETEPQIAVCGLNPHAGEDGLFGNHEEERIIGPAIEQAKKLGFNVTGPFPPDTCFIPDRRMNTDCFVCMYHDQGHIPLKALAFDQAVNCTLGLPIIRTSVDHGTAFDIAGKGMADPSSLIQAVKLAAKMASKKMEDNVEYSPPQPLQDV